MCVILGWIRCKNLLKRYDDLPIFPIGMGYHGSWDVMRTLEAPFWSVSELVRPGITRGKKKGWKGSVANANDIASIG